MPVGANGLITAPRDYLTILVVRRPRNALMTKRLFRTSDRAIGKADYDEASLFDVQKQRVESFTDLVAVLCDLSNRSDRFVIRGKLRDSGHNIRRRLHGSDATFIADAEGHHWVLLDFDEIDLPLFLEPDDDAELLTGYLVRLLPRPFWSASYFWQWSCGQGVDGGKTLRCHLWFWSREKRTDLELENWALTLNGEAGERILDQTVFRTVQPNYTSAPVIDPDVPDPIPHWSRCGIHIGDQEEVAFTLPREQWKNRLRQQKRAESEELQELGLRPAPCLDPVSGQGRGTGHYGGGERYLEYLNRIGDDKDGFYEPMRMAIWHWASTYPDHLDAAFKEELRHVVRAAKCDKQRDLDEYLSDYRLDASLHGAREKQQVIAAAHPPTAPLAGQNTGSKPATLTLAAFQKAMRRYSFSGD
jgi:hypothetical protein